MTRIIFWSYEDSVDHPATIWVNLFFAISFILAATGGVTVAYHENKVRKANPNRFGPGPIALFNEYYRKYCCRCCVKSHQGNEEEEKKGHPSDSKHDAENPSQEKPDEERKDHEVECETEHNDGDAADLSFSKALWKKLRDAGVTPFDRNAMRLFAM